MHLAGKKPVSIRTYTQKLFGTSGERNCNWQIQLHPENDPKTVYARMIG